MAIYFLYIRLLGLTLWTFITAVNALEVYVDNSYNGTISNGSFQFPFLTLEDAFKLSTSTEYLYEHATEELPEGITDVPSIHENITIVLVKTGLNYFLDAPYDFNMNDWNLGGKNSWTFELKSNATATIIQDIDDCESQFPIVQFRGSGRFQVAGNLKIERVFFVNPLTDDWRISSKGEENSLDYICVRDAESDSFANTSASGAFFFQLSNTSDSQGFLPDVSIPFCSIKISNLIVEKLYTWKFVRLISDSAIISNVSVSYIAKAASSFSEYENNYFLYQYGSHSMIQNFRVTNSSKSLPSSSNIRLFGIVSDEVYFENILIENFDTDLNVSSICLVPGYESKQALLQITSLVFLNNNFFKTDAPFFETLEFSLFGPLNINGNIYYQTNVYKNSLILTIKIASLHILQHTGEFHLLTRGYPLSIQDNDPTSLDLTDFVIQDSLISFQSLVSVGYIRTDYYKKDQEKLSLDSEMFPYSIDGFIIRNSTLIRSSNTQASMFYFAPDIFDIDSPKTFLFTNCLLENSMFKGVTLLTLNVATDFEVSNDAFFLEASRAKLTNLTIRNCKFNSFALKTGLITLRTTQVRIQNLTITQNQLNNYNLFSLEQAISSAQVLGVSIENNRFKGSTITNFPSEFSTAVITRFDFNGTQLYNASSGKSTVPLLRINYITGVNTLNNILELESSYFVSKHHITVLSNSNFLNETLRDDSSILQALTSSYLSFQTPEDDYSRAKMLILEQEILQTFLLEVNEDSETVISLGEYLNNSFGEELTDYKISVLDVANNTFSFTGLFTTGVLNLKYNFTNSSIVIRNNTIKDSVNAKGVWLNVLVPNDLSIRNITVINVMNENILLSILDAIEYTPTILTSMGYTIEVMGSAVELSASSFISVQTAWFSNITIGNGIFGNSSPWQHFIALTQDFQPLERRIELFNLKFNLVSFMEAMSIASMSSFIFIKNDRNVGDWNGTLDHVIINNVSIISSKLENIESYNLFSVFLFIESIYSELLVSDFVLENSTKQDGQSYISINCSSIQLTNVNIQNNQLPKVSTSASLTSVGAILLMASKTTVVIQSSHFQENYEAIGSSESCSNSILWITSTTSVTLTNLSVDKNSGCGAVFLQAINLAKLTITGSEFEDNIASKEGIINIDTCNRFIFTNNIIRHSQVITDEQPGGALLYWTQANGADTIYLSDVTLSLVRSSWLKLIHITNVTSTSELLLEKLTIQTLNSATMLESDSYTPLNIQLLEAEAGTVNIADIGLQDVALGLPLISMIATRPIELTLRNFTLRNIEYSGDNQSIIHYQTDTEFIESNMEFQQVTFSNIILRQNSSIIHLESISSTQIEVMNSYFGNITAEGAEGAVVSMSSTNKTGSLMLGGSSFINCTAFRGAVVRAHNTSVITKSCLYESNQAEEAGAVFYLEGESSNLTEYSSRYINNTLSFQSPSNNTLSFKLSQVIFIFNETDTSNQGITVTNNNKTLIFSNISSYGLQKIKTSFEFVDERGSLYCLNKVKNIKLLVQSKKANITYRLDSCSSPCKCEMPQKAFPQLSGDPLDLLLLNLSISFPVGDIEQIYQFSFFVQLRDCVPGEIRSDKEKVCYYCDEGRYSLNPSDPNCFICPNDAKSCPGGNAIDIKPGFWRSSNSSDIILCPGGDQVCLGGVDSKCGKGSKGPLCVQCKEDEGWVKQSKGTCSSCSDNLNNIIPALVFVSGLLYQSTYVYSTYRSNIATSLAGGSRKELLGPYFRLFTYISSLSQAIDYSAMDFKSVLSSIGYVSNPYPAIFFSIDCYLLKLDLFGLELMAAKMLIVLVWPFVKLVFVCLIILFLRCIRKIEGIKSFFILAAGCLYMMDQSSVTSIFVNFFICKEFQPNSNQSFVNKYPNTECYTKEWYNILYALVIPGIILWTILFPLGFYITIRRRYSPNEKRKFYLEFGHFLKEFKPKNYYWGFLRILNTTILLIVVNAIQASRVRMFVTLLCVGIYYHALDRVAPYRFKKVFKLEKLFLILFTISTVLVLIAHDSNSSTTKSAFLIINFLINIGGALVLLQTIIILAVNKLVTLFKRIFNWLRRIFNTIRL